MSTAHLPSASWGKNEHQGQSREMISTDASSSNQYELNCRQHCIKNEHQRWSASQENEHQRQSHIDELNKRKFPFATNLFNPKLAHCLSRLAPQLKLDCSASWRWLCNGANRYELLTCVQERLQYELVASAGDESVLAGGESALTEPLTVTLFGAREC
eukprot:122477-Pelagomonas_calceolata.AAC.4